MSIRSDFQNLQYGFLFAYLCMTVYVVQIYAANISNGVASISNGLSF